MYMSCEDQDSSEPCLEDLLHIDSMFEVACYIENTVQNGGCVAGSTIYGWLVLLHIGPKSEVAPDQWAYLIDIPLRVNLSAG
jgi:hypothetical protein